MREGHEGEERKPCSDIELYAMGLLEGEERERMERHVAGCSDCRRELEQIEELLGLLPLAAEPAEPPRGMRERVLGQVLGRPRAERLENEPDDRSEPALPPDLLLPVLQEEDARPHPPAPPEETAEEAPAAGRDRTELPAGRAKAAGASEEGFARRRRFAVGALAGAAAVMLLVTGVLAQRMDSLGRENKRLSAELQASTQTLDSTLEQLRKTEQPSAGAMVSQIVSLKPVKDLVARGQAYLVVDDRGTHLIVQASRLPELKDEQAYQVWLIKGDKPVNAGTFKPTGNAGAVTFTFPGGSYDQVALTLEPDAFGQAPRGDVVLAGALKT
ncbi:anti-sigma factor [Paenibacillus albicereus]|uniref:Anti-sigma-W factor RsiW n=1 Tax=Paenibacillus albicereus TaxID=2726185 RepID=A0A6H2GZK4_9BACL|nr:anti-sigma factor [Paenibacillus albicereus]QJC52827.1 anti-sigma factor [Paenibacillus albicereus]